ncbi:protein AAR2 homolog isoform X1 [Hyalella azteca]|uniref:Protein AAR2 homolog n=1 Tax=Hyalella azteca TaxID=294128 RepID=A0A8B7NV76_HYAAZ|nr:protein AAR2 homolog isoform X1 [Hyalella azteca]XP_047739866.1 protein AAR2 homolog isoform X1 [Hyalella azteca]
MASYTSHEEKDFEKFLQCKGAALVLLNVPVHTEIGIDMHSWTIGPKFKGINLIPPGLHFINYSAVSKYGETAPATGFFHYFEPNDVLVKVYQPATEEFKDESPEQTERVKINLQSLRGELGPYPSELWRRWVSLTQKIDRRHLESVLPLSGMVSSVPAMVPVDDPNSSSTSNSDARKRLKTHQSNCGNEASTSSSMEDSSPSQQNNANNSTLPLQTNKITTTMSIDEGKVPQSVCNDSCSSQRTFNKSSTPSTIIEDMEQCTSKSQITELNVAKMVQNPSHNELCSGQEKQMRSTAKRLINEGLPELVPVAGLDFRWYELPERTHKAGATPAYITAVCIDPTPILDDLIRHLGNEQWLLSELQLSFVVFLVGQSWAGWERWKRLIGLLCSAETLMLRAPHIYSDLMATLHYQIHEVPEDLFVDIVEQNNFLAASLAQLFFNIEDNVASLPALLVQRAQKFRTHLKLRFGWSFDFDDSDEDAPVVVELEQW